MGSRFALLISTAMAACALGLACSEQDPAPASALLDTPASSREGTGEASGERAGPGSAPNSEVQAPAAVQARRGRFLKARRTTPWVAGADAENEELYEQLLALGYATGSRAPSGQGISVYDEARAFEGFNFYTSAHDEMAVLMDMRGNVLHEWHRSFADVIERAAPADRKPRHWWRRGWLLDNGDVVALNTGMGIMRLDKDSNVLWASDLFVHHDLVFRDDGGYIALTREARSIPWIRRGRPIIEDRVVFLDAGGKVERHFSILDSFERSPFKTTVFEDISNQVKGTRDLVHTNSIVSLDGRLADRHPAFAKGNLLLSFRALNAIGIVNPNSEMLVWYHKGEFIKQHDPKILANGNLLLFDNRGLGERSRILEFDPIVGSVEWQYVGSEQAPFFSATCGIADPLPNGNTLITESDNGRAFEVTRDGEIVWEFLSPHRAGKQGQLVATLPEVIRLPKDFPLAWLDSSAPRFESTSPD